MKWGGALNSRTPDSMLKVPPSRRINTQYRRKRKKKEIIAVIRILGAGLVSSAEMEVVATAENRFSHYKSFTSKCEHHLFFFLAFTAIQRPSLSSSIRAGFIQFIR